MKKYGKICAVLGVLLVVSLGCLGCSKPKEKFSTHSFDYFDTVTTITGYAKNQKEFDKVAEDILAELEEYHKLFTIYHRFDGMENLCTINELNGGEHRTVTVDPRIIDMLSYAKEMYEITEGAVNVAMGSVLSIWHEYRNDGIDDPSTAKLPPMEKLTEAALHTDISNLRIDKEAGTVTLEDPLMKLDVGAIAKGYAVELTARSLEEKGITGYVLNVGGNVRTIGGKEDGSKWTVGIEHPMEDAEDYLAYLELSGESLVTSGSYQRYYVVDGKRYHHIIDPETLMPSEGFLSVSVVCKSSAEGDALSTALFCMELEEGMALVEGLPEVEALWVTKDGTCHRSSGFNKYEKQ